MVPTFLIAEVGDKSIGPVCIRSWHSASSNLNTYSGQTTTSDKLRPVSNNGDNLFDYVHYLNLYHSNIL